MRGGLEGLAPLQENLFHNPLSEFGMTENRRCSMTCKERLVTYLRAQRVPFEVQHHPTAYTARDVAAIEHIPNELMTKVVMVFADGRLTMLVLPASHRVDLTRVGPMTEA